MTNLGAMLIALDTWMGSRRLLQHLAGTFTEPDRIPDGFANSPHWNVAHVLVTQQLLTYGLSDLELPLPAELVGWARKGTDASQPAPQPYATTCEQIVASAERFTADHGAGRFGSFRTYETSAGITLGSLTEAVHFNNLHEGIHLGYLLAQRKVLERQDRAQ